MDNSANGHKGGAGFVGLRGNTSGRSEVVFRSCRFEGNQAGATYPGGALAINNADATLEDCEFTHNAGGLGSALFVGDKTDASIRQCTFSDNTNGPPLHSSAIKIDANLDGPTTVVIENTIVAFTFSGSAISCSSFPASPSVSLSCCDLYGNTYGDWSGYLIADQFHVDGNFWGDPGFCDRPRGDYALHDTSPCAPDDERGCGLVGAQAAACHGDLVLVDPEGTGNFTTIQDALDDPNCEDWDVIELSSGTYSGPGNRDIDFLRKSVLIRSASGDPRDCTIDCADSGRAFLFSRGENEGSRLQGVSLIRGRAQNGAAIFCDNSSPRIERCVVYACSATVSGGAVGSASGRGPTLLGCTLARNGAPSGGGIACAGSSRAFLKSTIIASSGGGGAVSCAEQAGAHLHCSDLYNNQGGDWAGCIEDQQGPDGNVSIEPCFCDESHYDFSLHHNSWCRTNDYCGLVGALDEGCSDGEDCAAAVWSVADLARSTVIIHPVPNPSGRGPLACDLRGISGDQAIDLRVYDVSGRFIRVLVDKGFLDDRARVTWDGLDATGRLPAPGVYFYRLRVNGQEVHEPFLIVR